MADETNRGTSFWIKYIAIVQTIVLALICWGFIQSYESSRAYQARLEEYNKRQEDFSKTQEAYKKAIANYDKAMEQWNSTTPQQEPRTP